MNTDREQLQSTLASRGLELGEPVCVRHVIEAAPDRVWQAIIPPDHLKQVHPFCRDNEVQQWCGAGSIDTITYYSGVHYQRDFVAWYDGVGYDIEIGPPSHKTAHVAWRINALDEQRSELSIEVTPYLKSDLAEGRKQAYERRFFGDVIAQYLDSVVRGVGHVVTTGQAVQKDQFGTHPIYSG
ncbi:hypothetical protein C2W62_00640 [Candidatus Entotheonella serta]|nr:hypothetical protein C2W62_00640 [Candidatus Entotheonella serta]